MIKSRESHICVFQALSHAGWAASLGLPTETRFLARSIAVTQSQLDPLLMACLAGKSGLAKGLSSPLQTLSSPPRQDAKGSCRGMSLRKHMCKSWRALLHGQALRKACTVSHHTHAPKVALCVAGDRGSEMGRIGLLVAWPFRAPWAASKFCGAAPELGSCVPVQPILYRKSTRRQ